MTTEQELPEVSFDLGTLSGDSKEQKEFVKFDREEPIRDKKTHYRILPPFGESA